MQFGTIYGAAQLKFIERFFEKDREGSGALTIHSTRLVYFFLPQNPDP